MTRRVYLVLVMFAGLASIGAGGAAIATPHQPARHVVRWGSSFWPDTPETLRVGIRAGASVPRAVLRRGEATEGPPVYGSGACGGSLPSCRVLCGESGGDIRAVNRRNPNRPAGKWQIITSTWGDYEGYPTADAAPEDVQDAKAAKIYAGGAGRGQWTGSC